MLQRDYSVNHACKCTIRMVYTPCKDKRPFPGNTTNQRFGYEQPGLLIVTELGKIITVGNTFWNPVRHAGTVNDFAPCVGHPHPIEFRKTCGLAIKKYVEFPSVNTATGNLSFDLIHSGKQNHIDLVGATADVLLEHLGQVLGCNLGTHLILMPALAQRQPRKNDDE